MSTLLQSFQQNQHQGKWTCTECNSINSYTKNNCELCNARKPYPKIPTLVVCCVLISCVKFTVTAMLPFYGTLPPTNSNTIRTFLVADALSLENLAHCGLTTFLSILWWLTGVDFFGYGLYIVLLLLLFASFGEVFITAKSLYNYSSMSLTSISLNIHGPFILSAILFTIIFITFIIYNRIKIQNRSDISLRKIPLGENIKVPHAVLKKVHLLHLGLLLDIICKLFSFLRYIAKYINIDHSPITNLLLGQLF